MRVAVTGGSGRIGSEVIKELIARGHEPINIDRRQADKPLARFVYANSAASWRTDPADAGAGQ